jgi:hypothetical protein
MQDLRAGVRGEGRRGRGGKRAYIAHDGVGAAGSIESFLAVVERIFLLQLHAPSLVKLLLTLHYRRPRGRQGGREIEVRNSSRDTPHLSSESTSSGRSCCHDC